MRLAVLSDVHGNLPALEAVLADIQVQGAPDVTWVLGDMVAFCPWPAETLARLRALPGVSFLQGNTDRYVVTGRRPRMPQVDAPEGWPRWALHLSQRDANFRWTVERLSYADYRFLHDLGDRLAMDVPRYGRVVAVHATPGDDETNLYPDAPDEEVATCLAGLDARLMLYGHTHRPLDRAVGDVRLVNDGSVGLPLDGDPRPAYALLDFVGSECRVTIRRVAYDRNLVLDELARLDHPAMAWVSHILQEARA